MKGLIPIEKDLFSIADRLKEVDERYRVYRNTLAHRFEVFIGEALQFVVPFQKLDSRTVEYARKTRIERVDKIVQELDKQNQLLEKRKNRKIIEDALAQAGF